MTAAERLVALAGTTGTAAALLLVIGVGATAGAALVDYSGLSTGTAAEHLLTDVVVESPSYPAIGWDAFGRSSRGQRVVLSIKAAAITIEREASVASPLQVLPAHATVLSEERARVTGVLAMLASCGTVESGISVASGSSRLDWVSIRARDDEDLITLF